MVKFMFDPGHGGNDPGASANGVTEKDWVLDFMRRVRDHLEKNYTGFEIAYTRNSDRYVGLSERAQMANREGADYFVSFHNNAGGGTGFESYIYTSVGSATVQYQNAVHNEIAKFLRQNNIRDRGKKRANFAVIRETNMSAILLEYLFVDTKQDADLLKNDAFVDRFAAATADALGKAFGLTKIEKEVVSVPKQTVSEWAEKAQAWVKAQDISDGDRPKDEVTREELWTMLYRMNGGK